MQLLPLSSRRCVLVAGAGLVAGPAWATEAVADTQQAGADVPGLRALPHAFDAGAGTIPLERRLVERSLSVNTAAAGGNASLMAIG